MKKASFEFTSEKQKEQFKKDKEKDIKRYEDKINEIKNMLKQV